MLNGESGNEMVSYRVGSADSDDHSWNFMLWNPAAGCGLRCICKRCEKRFSDCGENHTDNGRAYGGSRNLEGFRLADLSVGRNRKVYEMDWLSGRIGAAYSCKDVFFFGSNRFAIRYL